MKKLTGYPSIDRIHFEGVRRSELNPYIPDMSVSAAIDFLFRFKGKRYVFDCNELRITHREFREDSVVLGNAFYSLGIRPGDVVIVALPYNYQAVLSFKALNRIGAVTTFLAPNSSEADLKKYIEKYKTRFIINYNRTFSDNEKMKNECGLSKIVTLKPEDTELHGFDTKKVEKSDFINWRDLGYYAFLQRGIVKTNFGSNQDAVIMYTSGSTGEPKSMLFTNGNLISALIYLKNSTHVKKPAPGTKWLALVPFGVPYGFSASVLTPIFCGVEVILTPDLSTDKMEYYYGKKPELIFGSPAIYELIRRKLPDDFDFSKLKMFVSGGDFLSESQSHDIKEYFKKHGGDAEVCNGSGNGEILGCCTNSMNVPYRPDTVGQLVVGPDYVILDESLKNEVKYGEKGILCVSGRHVFKEYVGMPESTKESFIEYNGKRYYKTGNIGSLGRDRYFTMVGRASRFYISSVLSKVYCEMVQRVVAAIDAVDSCAIVPKPDKEMLYVSKAYVVLKEGFEPGREMEEYIIEKSALPFHDVGSNQDVVLKPYERPVSVTFLDKLPRTKGDKIDYETMAKMAAEE